MHAYGYIISTWHRVPGMNMARAKRTTYSQYKIQDTTDKIHPWDMNFRTDFLEHIQKSTHMEKYLERSHQHIFPYR